MTAQLSLAYLDLRWVAIADAIAGIVARRGLKQVAFDLDVQPSVLSNALAGRDRHVFRAEWLPYFLAHDTDGALIRALADCGGWDVARRIELTPAEERDRLRHAIDALPEAVRDALYASAGVRR